MNKGLKKKKKKKNTKAIGVAFDISIRLFGHKYLILQARSSSILVVIQFTNP